MNSVIRRLHMNIKMRSLIVMYMAVIVAGIAMYTYSTSPKLAHAFTILSLTPAEMSNEQKQEKIKELMAKNYALLYETESVGDRNLLRGSALRKDKPMYDFFAQQMGYLPNFDADSKLENELEAARLAAFYAKYPEKIRDLNEAERKLKAAQDAMDKINALRGEPNADVARAAHKALLDAQHYLAELTKRIEAIMIADKEAVKAQSEMDKISTMFGEPNPLVARAVQEALLVSRQKLEQALRDYDNFVKNMP